MKPNKIKALLGSEKGHKEIEIPFYTKSQVDEKMDKAKELWLKERDIMDKMIEQLLDEVKQLKAKLKEQAEYYEKLIETLDKNYPSDCSKVRPIDVQRMWDIITNYNVEEKKWVGKE